MLQTKDQLVKDQEYLLPEELVEQLVAAGVAVVLLVPAETRPSVGPKEKKPAGPSEFKGDEMKTAEAEPIEEPEPEEEEPEPEEEEPEPEPEHKPPPPVHKPPTPAHKPVKPKPKLAKKK